MREPEDEPLPPVRSHGAIVLYVVVMVAVIVGMDVAFFRNRFWVRLAANVGTVLVFGAFWWRFLRRR